MSHVLWPSYCSSIFADGTSYIPTSTCSRYQIQWLPARCIVTIYSVFTSLLLLFSALRANNNFVSNSWLRYVRHFSGEFSPKSQPQHTVSWSDPRLVVVRLLDCLIDCVLHSYRSHHYQSCDTAWQRDSVRGRVRITCHVARGTQFVTSDCGELTLYTYCHEASLWQRLTGNEKECNLAN